MTEEYFDDFWQAKAITQIGSRGLPHLIDSIKDDEDLREGVFGPNGYFQELQSDSGLQRKYAELLKEFDSYRLK